MSNIKTYSLKRDGEKKITPNFQVKEVRCHDGTDTIKIDYVTVCIAQLIRDITKASATVNSAYRTATWNKKEGGASNSQHLYGRAMDMVYSGKTPQEIGNYAYSIGLVRVGVYSTFTHFDTARTPQWLSQGNFKKVNIPYQGILLKRGVTHYLVAIVQYKLNCLGYNCGTEDGIAGIKFETAIKNFQKAKGLTQDGKCGLNTWNKLFN